jgi:membrane protein DedA with SNARE-associated domain
VSPLNLNELMSHCGYLAIFAVVVLGNVGLPVPEETILALGGYLCSQGKLRIPLLLAVGVISAIAGDNLGYWVGRRYGPGALTRYGAWLLGGHQRVERARAFVGQRGAAGVFLARFIPGMRFAAGPLAGALGMPFTKFAVPNALGAAAYVPLVVGVGYAVGYGLGGYIEPLRHMLGEVEHVVLAIAVVATAVFLARRVVQGFRAKPKP